MKKLVILLLLLATPALGQTTVVMKVIGKVQSSNGITVAVGDAVLLALKDDTSQTIATGAVMAADGSIVVEASQPSSFNSTEVVLLYKQAGKVYRLLLGSSAINFEYLGTPTTNILDITPDVGDFITIGTLLRDDGGAAPVTSSSPYDLNGDGRIGDDDVQAARATLGKRGNNLAADINNDGRVTTKDMGMIMRAVQTQQSNDNDEARTAIKQQRRVQ